MAQTSNEANSQQSDSEDVETRPQTPTASSNKPPMLTPTRRSTDGRPSDVTPTSPTSDHEESHNVKTISIPSAHPRPHHTRSQSMGSLKERIASHASPPGSERESEPGSTTDDDDEDSEVELEEDIEEVCPCPNLTRLLSEPDMLPAGREKDSAIRRYGKGLPPHVTLLFGLPTCGRSAFRPSLVELVLHLPCYSVPTHAVSLLLYRTIPNSSTAYIIPLHMIIEPRRSILY